MTTVYLEHCQHGLNEVVKIMPRFVLHWVKIKAATEDLHAQKSKDNNKEEEQEQQGGDGLDGVEKGSNQVGE